MKQCVTCKRRYIPSSRHKKCPRCRVFKAKIPCPKCQGLMRRYSKLCYKCRSRRGKNNGSWKGGVVRHARGYIYIRKPNHPIANKIGYIFEHRLVMEKRLKRYLFPNENIHHINGVKDDNRIENLELWVKPQPSGIRATDALKWAKEIIKRYDNLL